MQQNREDPRHAEAAETLGAEPGIETDRSRERHREDAEYIPVIVKRSDDAPRHPDDALERAIAQGMEQLRRRTISLALSSLAAGLILGFSAMAAAVVTQLSAFVEGPLLRRLAVALVYPLGFVICISSGTQLFTEHTATAVYPVLDGKAPLRRLLRLWVIVIAGNLCGAAVSAYLLTATRSVLRAEQGFLEIAAHLVEYDVLPLLISAVLAGWLMALGAWLVMVAPPGVSQMLSLYIVTFLIGVGGFHHSIVGSVEIFAALMLSDRYTAVHAAQFIGLALLGNLIGGSVLVALLNYGHIRRTQASYDRPTPPNERSRQAAPDNQSPAEV